MTDMYGYSANNAVLSAQEKYPNSIRLSSAYLDGYELTIPEGCSYASFSSYSQQIPGGGSVDGRHMRLYIKRFSYGAILDRIQALEESLGQIGGKLDQILE